MAFLDFFKKKPVPAVVQDTTSNQLLTLRVIQFDKKEIRKYIPEGGGAAYKMVGNIHTIYIPYPDGMDYENDYIWHQQLGHELAHALGMKHI